jgi:hypothetical protein
MMCGARAKEAERIEYKPLNNVKDDPNFHEEIKQIRLS